MSGVVEKYYRYFVTSPSRVFITEWTDVVNDYRHTDEINTFGSPLEVKLGRTARNTQVQLSNLLDESGDEVLDEDGRPIVTEDTATVNVGEGTDIYEENFVDVYEYYGSTDTVLDETGDPVLDEASMPIISEEGALAGRRVFFGYISQYRVSDATKNESISVKLLPLATDYSNMIFENFSYTFMGTIIGTPTETFQDLVQYNGTDRYTIAQSFTAPATGPYLRLLTYFKLPSDAWELGRIIVTVKLYTGSDPNGSRTLLHTGTLSIDGAIYAGMNLLWANNIVEGPELTSGDSYHVDISLNKPRTSGGNAPIQLMTVNSGYSGGSYWYRSGAGSTYTEDATQDLGMWVDVLTNRETKATYSGWTLAAFVDQTMDLVTIRGGRTDPNNSVNDYIEDPGIDLPVTELNMNTYKDRMDVAVKAAPYGWYYRYDHASNAVRFRSRHETADHILVAGVHIQEIEVERDTEQIVNVVYLTGGPYPTETDPPLFRRYADYDSIAKYRIHAKSVSDGRIKNPDSADIRGEYELAAAKDPVYRTTVTVLDRVYDVSTIWVGQTVGFSGHGDFRDNLVLQVMRKETVKGKVILTLGSLPPTERKRLADLKTALDAMAVAENDASPS